MLNGRTARGVQTKVCVVGPDSMFLSGLSYYTKHLANALSAENTVSVLLIRRLVPRFLYPGRNRVGHPLDTLEWSESVRVFDGVDWYWLPSMFRALRFLRKERPDVVVFQWWTTAVLHSYLLLAAFSRAIGARVVVELHETQDPGEAKYLAARMYARGLAPLFMRQSAHFVVHSHSDLKGLRQVDGTRVADASVIPHGPYDHFRKTYDATVDRGAPDSCFNLLYFGLIRPYKGVPDLIEAFDLLTNEEATDYWLTIVGETWEGCTEPGEMIRFSRHRGRITFINRYVSDEEAGRLLAGADAIVLPYRRTSSSGVLHAAMSLGLPVIITDLPGLREDAAEYEGAIVVPPANPSALASAFQRVRRLRGHRYRDPHSWSVSRQRYADVFAKVTRA